MGRRARDILQQETWRAQREATRRAAAEADAAGLALYQRAPVLGALRCEVDPSHRPVEPTVEDSRLEVSCPDCGWHHAPDGDLVRMLTRLAGSPHWSAPARRS